MTALRLWPLLLLLFGCATASREQRVLASLQPAVEIAGRTPVRWTLAERMAHYQVPGVSIAVADHGRLVWSHAAGVLQVGRPEAVTSSTPFQAASISKVIAATATLRLVDRGILGLDADVNRDLTSWKVPENELTATQKVTLRRLLSHTAGTSVHGFRGYGPDEAKPSLLEVLEARPPVQNQPIRVVAIPGTATSYSGGGIAIEQLVLTDVTGKPFPDLARDLVLAPAGMHDSTFEQPLPPAFAACAARGHDEDGRVLPGGWRIGPEMAAGWLWTTASDLVRWAVAIDRSRQGKPHALLSQRSARDMLTVQKDSYGLGPLLEGSGRAFRFSHGGNNPGYTTQLTYFPETGQGLAILINKVGADQLIDEIMRAVAEEYGWPALQARRVVPARLSEAAAARLAGHYDVRFPGANEDVPGEIRREGARLLVSVPPYIVNDEILPLSETELISPAWGYTMKLSLAPSGEVTGFVLTYLQNVITARRKP
jgi:CubicO group peptidase (beta-lactamase class C family)